MIVVDQLDLQHTERTGRGLLKGNQTPLANNFNTGSETQC